MFRNLLQFLKGKDFLNQMLTDFQKMLDNAEKMYYKVTKKLLNNEGEKDLRNNIYEIDNQINELQKNIRKRIIEHLSLQPNVDMATSLLLMSVIKDAERLGDHSKNLLEVNDYLEKPIDRKKYLQLFGNIDQEIANLFKDTKSAFIDSDEVKAANSWEYERTIAKKCDKILEKLAKSNLSVNEVVCFVLIARHFKRITAHLTNIATSVILPLSDLDYYDEKRKK